MPNFALERAAGGRVAGVDEAGRGPLAGPVVASAVVFPTGVPRKLAGLLDDSKKLTAEQREEAYAAITGRGDVCWAVAAAGHEEIDRVNILRASHEAMRRAVEELNVPHPRSTVGDRVTISLGVATGDAVWPHDVHELVAAADQALYQAKHEGRNRVCS